MSENTIITYETLYEILRREKSRPELQELDESFYRNLVKYIEEKKAILESQRKKESIFTSVEIQKTSRQIENILKLVRELYEKRESKIIQLALISSKNNANLVKEKAFMLNEERNFYSEILTTLDRYRLNLLNNLLEGQAPIVSFEPKGLKIDQGPIKKNKRIKFIELVPQFVGLDLNTYGPYEKEDIEELPEEVADLLIRRKVVEEVK